MPDPTLFHGIAVLIDDEIDIPESSVRVLKKAIEEAGCHVVPLSEIPNPASIANLREVSFFVLDWNLYGHALKEAAAGGNVIVPAGMAENNLANAVKLLKDLKQVRFAPVFIFTDEVVEEVRSQLEGHEGLDAAHILVMRKSDVAQEGVFNVLSRWMKDNPSVYVLKKWERAYEKAKNELFVDFYVKSRLWPLIIWSNFEDDHLPASSLAGRLIGRNLFSRMSLFTCDLEPFSDQLQEIKKDPSAYGEIVRKVFEGERFLAENRLDEESFEPGDIFELDDGYYINIRPDCDCIPRGHDKLASLDLYLLRGGVRDLADLNLDPTHGVISEQDNEATIFPVYDGKALGFKFKKLYTKKWRELKGKRRGRLLPPVLTRLQQRYAAYLQRPGITRVPAAAFPLQPPVTEVKPEPTVAGPESDAQSAIVQTDVPMTSKSDEAPSEIKPKSEPPS